MLEQSDVERIADEIVGNRRKSSGLMKFATLGGRVKVNDKLRHLYLGDGRRVKSFVTPKLDGIRKLTRLGRY